MSTTKPLESHHSYSWTNSTHCSCALGASAYFATGAGSALFKRLIGMSSLDRWSSNAIEKPHALLEIQKCTELRSVSFVINLSANGRFDCLCDYSKREVSLRSPFPARPGRPSLASRTTWPAPTMP